MESKSESIMREYKLYLEHTKENDIEALRWRHLFDQIDRENQTVRTYIIGVDIPRKEFSHKCPYVTLDGAPIGFTEAFEKIMVMTGKAIDAGFFDGEI
jgi:hypothetical protein